MTHLIGPEPDPIDVDELEERGKESLEEYRAQSAAAQEVLGLMLRFATPESALKMLAFEELNLAEPEGEKLGFTEPESVVEALRELVRDISEPRVAVQRLTDIFTVGDTRRLADIEPEMAAGIVTQATKLLFMEQQ